MADAKVTRRLAAILAADVVGYSKMMGADEAGTLAALRDIWQAEFDPCIGRHNGRIAKKMGDGALAEFASVVDAVSCAVAFQRAMAARNSAQNSAQNNGDAAPIEFRIGVNLGDIWIEDGDIFGDGVNIAARLEGLAPAGGVLTSDSVYGQVVRQERLPKRPWNKKSTSAPRPTARKSPMPHPAPDRPWFAPLIG